MLDKQTEGHLKDLFQEARRKRVPTYSAFLTLDEQEEAENLFHGKATYSFEGGYEDAERKVILFFEEGEEKTIPLCLVKIEAKGKKFAESLTHRDYLGSLMGLGIERDAVGDILLGEGEAYVYCLPSVVREILSLTQVRHTAVKTNQVELGDCPYRPKIEEVRIVVPSLRLDAILGEVFHLSRQKAKDLILTGLVRYGSKVLMNGDRPISEGTVISVQHQGKFVFLKDEGLNKKGKNVLRIGFFR